MEILKLNFKGQISDYKNMIDNELLDIYKDGPAIIKQPIDHILSGGKRIRPILCYLTVISLKGDENNAIIVSTAIELLHNFTLIHDDIMDNDDLRHGQATIHSKWDKSIAILSGDAMLAIALIKLNSLKDNKSKILEKFNKALIEVCEGQALDLSYQDQHNISVDDYINMIDKKTAYMIGLSSELGSIISNTSVKIQENLKKYGMLLGRAFQIQDDLFEVTSDSNIMGKSLKSDFLLNKKTYLSVQANLIEPKIIDEYIKIAKNDYNYGFKLYKDFLLKNNIINKTEDVIKNIMSDANKILKECDLELGPLSNYTNLILQRKY